jgi:hypothetical protein
MNHEYLRHLYKFIFIGQCTFDRYFAAKFVIMTAFYFSKIHLRKAFLGGLERKMNNDCTFFLLQCQQVKKKSVHK